MLSRPVEVSAGRLDVLHTASRGDNDSLRRLGQKAYQILLTHGTAGKKTKGGLSAGFAAYAVFEGVGSKFASVASRSNVMNGAIAVGRKCELGQDFCECGQPHKGGWADNGVKV